MNILDPHSVLSSFGALAIFVVLVLETGLLVGVVLPGDSLLFTAGLLCATSRGGVHLSLPTVLVCSIAGALLGAQLGFVIGRRTGSGLLDPVRRPRLQAGVERARTWLDRYGQAKAVVLARFIPVLRTIVNPLAGIVAMPTRTFVLAQVGGGLVWTVGVVLAGYALGTRVPNIDTYLLPIIAVVVVLSLVPAVIEVVRLRRHRAQQTSEPTPARSPHT